MGGKIIPRIRPTSAKVIVEVEDELGNYGDCHASNFLFAHFVCPKFQTILGDYICVSEKSIEQFRHDHNSFSTPLLITDISFLPFILLFCLPNLF